jgi:hypothetical protein
MNDAVDVSDVDERRVRPSRRRSCHDGRRQRSAETEQEAGASNEGRLHVTSRSSLRSRRRAVPRIVSREESLRRT